MFNPTLVITLIFNGLAMAFGGSSQIHVIDIGRAIAGQLNNNFASFANASNCDMLVEEAVKKVFEDYTIGSCIDWVNCRKTIIKGARSELRKFGLLDIIKEFPKR